MRRRGSSWVLQAEVMAVQRTVHLSKHRSSPPSSLIFNEDQASSNVWRNRGANKMWINAKFSLQGSTWLQEEVGVRGDSRRAVCGASLWGTFSRAVSWGGCPAPGTPRAALPAASGSQCSWFYCSGLAGSWRPAGWGRTRPAERGTATGNRTDSAGSSAGPCWRSCPSRAWQTVSPFQRRSNGPSCWWLPCAGGTAPAGGRGSGERRSRSESEPGHCWTKASQSRW